MQKKKKKKKNENHFFSSRVLRYVAGATFLFSAKKMFLNLGELKTYLSQKLKKIRNKNVTTEIMIPDEKISIWPRYTTRMMQKKMAHYYFYFFLRRFWVKVPRHFKKHFRQK